MTDRIPAPAGVHVTTHTHSLPPIPMLPAYQALAERFGPDQVYLLESTAGPVRDRRYQFVGFGALLTLSVTDGEVHVAGLPALCQLLLDRAESLLVAPSLASDGGGDSASGSGSSSASASASDTEHRLRLRTPQDLWPLLRTAQATFDAQGSADRFRFGFLGYFGYDTVRYIEELPRLIDRRPALPDVQIVLHQGCVISDLEQHTTDLVLHESAHWRPLDEGALACLLRRSEHTHPEPSDDAFPDAFPDSFLDSLPEATVIDDTEPEVFAADVERCLKHIAVGDIYQVQIGHELAIRSAADPVDVYRRLRRRNASPYMYLAGIGGQRVIGASPELFVRVEGNTVTMRPIAGTLPQTGEDDGAGALRLSSDPKEIAEHTMLVDLCRNDIGRISRPDTLQVPDRLTVERYSHVLHLVSTVVGEAEPDEDAFGIIAALFPAGTMTGTPKIRAMEIIESVERSRRGLYAGALGLIDVGGYTNLALCIRTLFHHDGVFRTRASAGIVADSRPDAEWRETLAKMSAAHWAVTGRELL
ncbi:anthranilate synthase component I family protein [Streptomyces sp. NPDC056061]|uniref:anthranilate synthase component I family protein n=1 Tax=Streptomyces sp. NPDC056061 TaxID=3345700 RepID=UPI0035E294D4